MTLVTGRGILGLSLAYAQSSGAPPRAVPGLQLIAVERGVNLEVVDAGGTGRPLVLLAGLGATATDLGDFALRLASTYHVYGITRRGFGGSSAPVTGYTTDRLGDDVLAVIDSLHLERPVVVGHSFAGAELSSIGSRHPEKVAGLVYLDAAYWYAFYDPVRGNYRVDLNELRRRLDRLSAARGDAETGKLIEQLLKTDLPAFDRAIRDRFATLPVGWRDSAPPSGPPRYIGAVPSAALDSILAGTQRYTDIRAPILAIYALPHAPPPFVGGDSAGRLRWSAGQADQSAQAEAFTRAFPTAEVVRIPNADHAVFASHPDEVLNAMYRFIAGLPR